MLVNNICSTFIGIGLVGAAMTIDQLRLAKAAAPSASHTALRGRIAVWSVVIVGAFAAMTATSLHGIS